MIWIWISLSLLLLLLLIGAGGITIGNKSAKPTVMAICYTLFSIALFFVVVEFVHSKVDQAVPKASQNTCAGLFFMVFVQGLVIFRTLIFYILGQLIFLLAMRLSLKNKTIQKAATRALVMMIILILAFFIFYSLK